MAQQLDVTVDQGEAWVVDVTITDLSGDPVDLTGLTGEALSYKIGVEGNANVVTKTLSSGITLTSAGAGQARITLDGDDTAIPKGSYRHELKLTTPTLTTLVFKGAYIAAFSLHGEG